MFIDTPENITGLSGIVNKKKTKNLDLTAIERDMLKSFPSKQDAKDAVTDFKEEMLKITKESGIDFTENWDPDEIMSDNDPFKDISSTKKTPSLVEDEEIFGKREPPPRYNPAMTTTDIRNNRMKPDESDPFDDFDSVGSSAGNPFANSSKGDPFANSFSPSDMDIRHKSREQIQYTDEQKRQSHINKFMNSIEENDGEIYDLGNAEIEDDKNRLLDRIDTLRTILEEDEVDISHIQEVDRNSKYDEIKYVHRMLAIKNDTRRCSSLAEEGVLMVAYALEDIFDGKRTFFGRFRPNLVGWHTTAQNKLRRMRYETSTIVSDTLKKNNVGYVGRIGLELIPSMIIYSKRKQSVSTEQDYTSTDEFKEALRDIRN